MGATLRGNRLIRGLLAAVTSAALVATGAAPGHAASSITIALLQPVPDKAEEYARAGVDLVTLELGWDAYQPTDGTTNRAYVEQRLAEARRYKSAGLDVVLDLGIQYPPSWAWELPGDTRFVNQYGQQWRGGIGDDVLDGVWNPAVRRAQSAYVSMVARDFGGVVDRVRVGGLLYGELRLPPARSAGRVDSLWSFSRGALAASPDPAWRPGKGTTAQAKRWLGFYMSSVSGYAEWMTGTVGAAFPGVGIDALLPGWGVRPGDIDRVAAARVSTAAVVSTGDDLANGLDWQRQISALDRLNLDVTAVTTWVDAPTYGAAARDLAPVEYLATLTKPIGMPLSGENTGGGGAGALERTREQAARWGLERVTWMSGRTLGLPGEVTLSQLTRAFDG